VPERPAVRGAVFGVRWLAGIGPRRHALAARSLRQ
jgi:hypothetical protein